MSLLSWNCQGIGGPRKQEFLTKLLQAMRSNICFLSETKCSTKKSKKVFEKMPLQNFAFVPARGRSGGLCLMWDGNVSLQVKERTRFFFHSTVTEPNGREWELVCVYGDANHVHNPEIWGRFLKIIEGGAPVCIMGDFNAIANEEENVGGDPVLNKNNRDFRDFLFQGGLIDLGFKGPAFTWTNKRHASEAIFERLDRVVATVEWLQLHTHAYVNHLPRSHSDHAAILLQLKKKEKRQKKV